MIAFDSTCSFLATTSMRLFYKGNETNDVYDHPEKRKILLPLTITNNQQLKMKLKRTKKTEVGTGKGAKKVA